MSSPSRVRIAICRDSAEAALVRAVLTGHDIPVHISGEHHAAIFGLGSAVIRLDVFVSPDDAEEASALIHEMREGGEGSLADDEIPADDDTVLVDETAPSGALVASGEDTLTRLGKRKRIGLALLVGVFVTLGTAHMSARAWKRGIALAAIEALGFWHVVAGNAIVGSVLMVGAVATDLIGAVILIARSESSIPHARATQRA